MKKYRCSLCGYRYDESKEKIKFEDLPDNWTCPLCGAPKALFEEVKESSKEDAKEVVEKIEETDVKETDDLRKLTNYEISLICSNLARGCEKQYLEEERLLFTELSKYYESKDENKKGTLKDISNLVKEDINNFNEAMQLADKYQDRGAKRVITWSSKVSNIMKIILENYEKKGIDYLKNTKIWVCDICGFVFIGDVPPKICPICKVPSFKILEVN